MTVKELIKALDVCDEDLVVCFSIPKDGVELDVLEIKDVDEEYVGNDEWAIVLRSRRVDDEGS